MAFKAYRVDHSLVTSQAMGCVCVCVCVCVSGGECVCEIDVWYHPIHH